MQQRIVWVCMAILCFAAAGCNKKVKKTVPATESQKAGQSLVGQKYPELAQAADEYGNEDGNVTDYDYGTGDDPSADDDNGGDTEYDENDYPSGSSDEESTAEDSNDDTSEDTGW